MAFGKTADIIVIGAGPAGLGAGIALHDRALVLEQRRDAGGLSGTFELGGAIFDLGGHSFHTPHPAIRDLVVSATPMEEQRRQAWCFVEGEIIPYPFQRNFTALKDEAVREACRIGLERVGDGRGAPNFDRYIDERFGAGVARYFMRPYNQKLWGVDLSRLATDWTGERVASPSKIAERFSSEGGRRAPLQHDTSVGYPARGGFGEIFRALARQVPRLRFDQTVTRIDPRRRELTTAGGETLAWSQLISTLPLPSLLQLLPDVPKAIRQVVAELQVLPVSLACIALTGPLSTPMQRVYSPDPDIIGHKIVLNHNSSSYLRNLPRHGIQVEISGVRQETDDELIGLAVKSLHVIGLLRGEDEIATTRVIRLPLGYPVPTHGHAEIVGMASAWLEARGIRTLGRFGEWAYINSDEAIYRGLSLGARLAGDGGETSPR
jgi:UDP-galactopyranose mutase